MGLSHRAATLAAAALLLTAGLSGCSVFGDSDSGPGSGSGSGSGHVTVGKDAATVDRFDKPVAQATFDSPYAAGAKIDVAIMGMRAKDKLMTLTVRFTAHVSADSSPNLFEMNGQHSVEPSLIDAVNLKRYAVVKDSGGTALGSYDVNVELPNGRPALTHYTYAVPPDGVKSIDVEIGDWPTFRDVPIER